MKSDSVDEILVYSIAGILIVGAIGMIMGVGKKDSEPGLIEPTKQAMSGKASCGCGVK